MTVLPMETHRSAPSPRAPAALPAAGVRSNFEKDGA